MLDWRNDIEQAIGAFITVAELVRDPISIIDCQPPDVLNCYRYWKRFFTLGYIRATNSSGLRA